jgi:hypothetical protein
MWAGLLAEQMNKNLQWPTTISHPHNGYFIKKSSYNQILLKALLLTSSQIFPLWILSTRWLRQLIYTQVVKEFLFLQEMYINHRVHKRLHTFEQLLDTFLPQSSQVSGHRWSPKAMTTCWLVGPVAHLRGSKRRLWSVTGKMTFRGKSKCSEKRLPQFHTVSNNFYMDCPGIDSELLRWKPTTNCLSRYTTFKQLKSITYLEILRG